MRLLALLLTMNALPALAELPSGVLPDGVHTPCATPHSWRPLDPVPLPDSGQHLELQHRDPYHAPHVLTSEHFALRYGDEGGFDHGALVALLEAFELAWDVQIDEMGHLAPHGSDEAYFNIYVGDSDPQIPEGRGAAGYYTADRHGWPMIVVAANTLHDRDYADITAAHEFYHAIQGATGRYTYDSGGRSAWFWEASATWASSEVYPDHAGYAAFLPAYAFLPHQRVDLYASPRHGELEEYYAYGAFIFLTHLVDEAGTTDVVRDAWLDGTEEPSPLEVMRVGLAERGLDLDALWLSHIARNVSWDYEQHDLFVERIEQWQARFPGQDHQVSAHLSRNGVPEWWSPPDAVLPGPYGATVFALEDPHAGTYTFEVRAHAFGVHGTTGHLGAQVVLEDRVRGTERVPVVFDGHHGQVTLEGLAGIDRAYLVVGAYTHEVVELHDDERFPFEVRLVHAPVHNALPPDEDPEAPRACGCGSSGGAGWAWIGLAGLWMRRRRR